MFYGHLFDHISKWLAFDPVYIVYHPLVRRHFCIPLRNPICNEISSSNSKAPSLHTDATTSEKNYQTPPKSLY